MRIFCHLSNIVWNGAARLTHTPVIENDNRAILCQAIYYCHSEIERQASKIQ